MRLAALVLLAAVLAGCGDDAPTAQPATTVDAAFSAKVEAACQELNKGLPAFPLPAGEFDRHNPTGAQLRAIRRYMITNQVNFERAPARLKAVGAPATGKAAWDTFLAALTTEVDSTRDRVTAAKAADVAAWKTAMTEADANNARLGSAFATAGVVAPTCSTYLGV